MPPRKPGSSLQSTRSSNHVLPGAHVRASKQPAAALEEDHHAFGVAAAEPERVPPAPRARCSPTGLDPLPAPRGRRGGLGRACGERGKAEAQCDDR